VPHGDQNAMHCLIIDIVHNCCKNEKVQFQLLYIFNSNGDESLQFSNVCCVSS